MRWSSHSAARGWSRLPTTSGDEPLHSACPPPRRTPPHIYVANWFFAAFIITVAVLHIGNAMALPVSLTKSYSVYAGVQDAMVQWWYGHNAVGVFLTARLPVR